MIIFLLPVVFLLVEALGTVMTGVFLAGLGSAGILLADPVWTFIAVNLLRGMLEDVRADVWTLISFEILTIEERPLTVLNDVNWTCT